MIRANDERLRQLLLGQQQVLQEVQDVLDAEQKKDDILSAVVLSSKGDHINHIQRLDPERVFSEESIRRLCVAYRLRFLDAGRFKGPLPPRALYELRRLELRSAAPLKGFKVMAPASRFKLCDSNSDPLLFVPVGPKHYYLVHRWGGDLSPWRILQAWPLRGPVELACSVIALAMLAAALLPGRMIGADPAQAWWGAHRVLALLWTSTVFASFTVFAWFAFFGKFSRQAWRDHRFN